jgi:hypothetical protein
VNILLDNPMTHSPFQWILSLNWLCQQWGQVQIDIDAFALNAHQFEEYTKSIWSIPTTATKLPVVPAKLRAAARKLRAS